ncbi:MAG: carboxy terminal-processing peptidase [Verrucomicrobia bacterium]|nr:carboxy terminal-processing peptidase [Verrucomicrobiota bacterium]MDA1005476.1 carboxy terminal-processing peptidase [Verrucomicrobiota bacterium]
MKRHLRIILPCALGLALLGTFPAIALRPGLRIDAATPDGQILQLNSQLLEQAQFAHRGLDDTMAALFLNRYIDALDSSHELFFKSDIDEFQKFLPKLAEATRRTGDTRAARAIYERYLQRSAERADLVEKVLGEETFEFTGNDRYTYDREDAPRPLDAAAAHALWRQRVRADFLQEKLDGKDAAAATKTLIRRYRRQADTMKNLGADAVLEIYINALAHVYDPHSDYMGSQQLETFNVSMGLSLSGVGAVLQSEGDYCEIRELVPGGPAARGGKLKAGDRIVAVLQGVKGEPADVFNLPLSETVKLIRGPKGTDVTLIVIPAGASDDARETITIRRDEVHFEDQEAKASIIDFPAGEQTTRIGVIDLPAFYASDQGQGQSATTDVARLIRKLKSEGVRGIILDLRRNGGGSLQEAIELTGLFIPSGAVVQTRDLSGQVGVGADEDGQTLYDGPLVVLTSRFSASASEILAGALQDYGRALIVGDSSTFGKGTVQTMLPLGAIMEDNGVTPKADPGVLKVTISKFYRPGGASTQLRGVRPDLVLPSFTDTPEISEAGLDNPMEWDAVPPARYPRFSLVKPYVSTLMESSRARIAADPDFAEWLKDLALVEKNRASKSVSLNEDERRRERNEVKERVEAQAARRLAQAATLPPVYEITLKNVDAPGLPEPAKAAANKPAADADPADTDPEEAPGTDLLLEETEHILSDYVQLLEPTKDPRPDTVRAR